MFDVIVVGARCAGASLAMLLARGGHRVAVVDRASFPSDTMSTHFLWPRAAFRLRDWGLLDRLHARGCAPIEQLTFDVGPVQMSGMGPGVEGQTAAYCPRRTVLDTVLVEAAVEAGADLIDGVVVDDVVWADGRVSGVRGRRRGVGGSVSLRAPLVVGADGLHSTVARRVAAHVYNHHPPLTCVYYSYWSGLGDVRASFHARTGQLILVWPTNDGLTCIYVGWPRREFPRVRTDLDRSFHAALDLVPGLRDTVASGHREQRFVGTADLPNQYRTSVGPGWALLGDAGHHKDPSTGMGIADAFLSADLLAEAIHSTRAGRPVDDALGDYQRQRDQLTANGFELALSTARLAPLSNGLTAFYRAAAAQPEVVERIFGVLGGSVPIRDVYSAPNIASVLAQANS
jgi:flavin-dependent dehydrogenase